MASRRTCSCSGRKMIVIAYLSDRRFVEYSNLNAWGKGCNQAEKGRAQDKTWPSVLDHSSMNALVFIGGFGRDRCHHRQAKRAVRFMQILQMQCLQDFTLSC